MKFKIVFEVQGEDRATVLEGRGSMLTHFSNGYFEVKGQDELFALTTSTSATSVTGMPR